MLALFLGLLAPLAHADPPAPELLQRARGVASCAVQRGEVTADQADLVALIDFSRPSVQPRFHVVRLSTGEVLYEELVSHGQGTGDDLATRFSNVEGSHQSSLGVFRTAETYMGKHGYSLRLDGLEPDINDQARKRAIVIHGADYVSEDFVEEVGRLGRSWGCPALRRDVSREVIDLLKEGHLLLAWHADWEAESAYASCTATP